MISYQFPPDTGSIRRVLDFIKYLPDYNWNPIILTHRSNHKHIKIDHELSKNGIKVYRSGQEYSVKHLAETFEVVSGLSDHTLSNAASIASIAVGGSVIEKHFTIDKELPGRDNKFALDTDEFKIMVQNIRLAEDALIEHGNNPMDIELDTMKNYRGRWGSNF